LTGKRKCAPKFLMVYILDSKPQQKILANQIQQHFEKFIYNIAVGSIQECMNGSVYANQ
jgi:hypothetical protein